MNTYLGVSSPAAPGDIDADTVAAGEVLYMEGYLYDRPEAKEAFRYAAEVAHDARAAGVADAVATRSASTATATTSGRSSRDEVDLLFGNEDELMSLYEVDDLDEAVAAVRQRLRAGGDHRRRRRAASS